MIYIGNSLSLQMIDLREYTLSVKEVGREEIPSYAYSVIGHGDLANILGVTFNRESITIQKGDVLYVAQITGGRLPEGCKNLPEGFKLKFLRVEIE